MQYAAHACLYAVFACATAAGQASPHQFEVASIKPSAPFAGKSVEGGPGTADPGQVTYHDRSLTQLLYLAYDIKSAQASLPSWMRDQHFDIVAKVPAGTTKTDLKAMLRNLLEERFHLKVGYESKETAAMVLTVGKNGIKMAEYPFALPNGFSEDTPRVFNGLDKNGFFIFPPGRAGIVISRADGVIRLSCARITLTLLSDALAHVSGSPVIDQTGLTGRYDVRLMFAQDQVATPTAPGEGSAPPAPDPAPSLVGAVEKQLGLRLERKRLPVDFFVIEHCDRSPTEN